MADSILGKVSDGTRKAAQALPVIIGVASVLDRFADWWVSRPAVQRRIARRKARRKARKARRK